MVISFTDVVGRIKDKCNTREGMLDIVVRPEITEIIQEAGLDPMRFTIDEESLEKFMNLPLSHEEEDGAFCSIYYDFRDSDAIYRAECRVILDLGNDTVDNETSLYKLPAYKDGNREWLFFCDGQWEIGPGEDFYEIQEVLWRK